MLLTWSLDPGTVLVYTVEMVAATCTTEGYSKYHGQHIMTALNDGWRTQL